MSGLRPSNCGDCEWFGLTWGAAPGWYRSGLRPSDWGDRKWFASPGALPQAGINRAFGPIITAMPQSLSLVIVHVIFSTKDRRGLLNATVRPNLHAYLATVTRNAQCQCYRVGGTSDHVHLAIRLARTLTIADLIEMLKTSSSRWLKTQSPDLADFRWQRGYGCFSVGPMDLDSVCAYIDNQENHHRALTFQEEFRKFLNKYGVKYDEAYVWD